MKKLKGVLLQIMAAVPKTLIQGDSLSCKIGLD
jgi:hypothetical protein